MFNLLCLLNFPVSSPKEKISGKSQKKFGIIPKNPNQVSSMQSDFVAACPN